MIRFAPLFWFVVRWFSRLWAVCVLSLIPTYAQLPFFLRVARQPADLSATTPGKPVKRGPLISLPEKKVTFNPQPPGGAPWIVFSDRDNNTTFRNPNGVTRFRKARFLDAFYVLKEKNGYLKLIQYDPKMPIGNKFSRRIISDRKAVVYYGWAPKSRFLLLNQSYRTDDGRHGQLVSPVLAHPDLLNDPTRYLTNDSVRTFTDPGLQGLSKTPSPLYALAYPFKQSESGRQVLIGRAGWFPADSIKQNILGWVPQEVLRSVGQRLFVEADTVMQPQHIERLYGTPSAALNHPADSVLNSGLFSTVAWGALGAKFPVLSQCCARDSQLVFQTHALTPLLAKREVPVFSVGGQRINNARLNQIRDRQRRLNVVYVIEGSSAMQARWGELLNTVQFSITQQLADTTSPFVSVQTAAVVYHETAIEGSKRKSEINNLPLTSDPARLFAFLSRVAPAQAANPTAVIDPQPIRFGVERALTLLANHADETNVIVLIGTTGDNQEVSGWGSVLESLGRIDCRVLAFQAFAFDNSISNDFVLQAKDLVLRAGQESSQVKKTKLVRPDKVTPATEFDLRLGDRNVYQLAYPDRSMVPGWVLFPRKQQALLLKELASATDSLLRQVRDENKTLLTALETTFAQIEPLTDRVNPALATLADKLGVPLRATPAQVARLSDYPYLTPAFTAIGTRQASGWKYTTLLTAEEYETAGRWLDALSADDVDPTRYADRVRLSRQTRLVLAEAGLAVEQTGTLSQLLTGLLDLPVKNELFGRIQLQAIAEPDQLPNALLNQVLYLLRERRDYFRRIPTFPNSRFTSNGKTYYWISEDLFK